MNGSVMRADQRPSTPVRLETASCTRHTAAEKSKAIDVLRDLVVIVRHPYESDPFSGAGNCWCGRHQGSSLHNIVEEP